MKKQELVSLIESIVRKQLNEDNTLNKNAKFSCESKTIYGIKYLFAYPDKNGIETQESLEKWEMSDKANRELQFVNNKKEAINAIKSFR